MSRLSVGESQKPEMGRQIETKIFKLIGTAPISSPIMVTRKTDGAQRSDVSGDEVDTSSGDVDTVNILKRIKEHCKLREYSRNVKRESSRQPYFDVKARVRYCTKHKLPASGLVGVGLILFGLQASLIRLEGCKGLKHPQSSPWGKRSCSLHWWLPRDRCGSLSLPRSRTSKCTAFRSVGPHSGRCGCGPGGRAGCIAGDGTAAPRDRGCTRLRGPEASQGLRRQQGAGQGETGHGRAQERAGRRDNRRR
jgi:hypothetical protein